MYFKTDLGDYSGLQPPEIAVESIAGGFTSPVDATFINDSIYLVDQIGVIYLLKDGEKKPVLDLSKTLTKLPHFVAGKGLNSFYDERGLLGMALHPEFPSNPSVYLYYSAPSTNKKYDHIGRLSQFQFTSLDKIDTGSENILLEVAQEKSSHNGGCVVFGPDGYLYLSLGDGGRNLFKTGKLGNSQNIRNPKGSILRMDVSDNKSTPVEDNPLISRGHPLIWVWGLRNPWRFSFDSFDRCFVGDVGEHHREAIYQVEKGNNCGWNILEGSHLYEKQLAKDIDTSRMTMPIFEYGPALGRCVIGGYLYEGSKPSLKNLYIFADASKIWPWRSTKPPQGRIYALKQTKDGWDRVALRIKGMPKDHLITSLARDPQNNIYLLTKKSFGPTGNTGLISRLV